MNDAIDEVERRVLAAITNQLMGKNLPDEQAIKMSETAEFSDYMVEEVAVDDLVTVKLNEDCIPKYVGWRGGLWQLETAVRAHVGYVATYSWQA